MTSRLVLLALLPMAALAQPTVAVSGYILDAAMQPRTGTITISWQTFTSGSQNIMAGNVVIKPRASDGFVSVALYPHTYTVKYSITQGLETTVGWVVPAGPPWTRTINEIQTSAPSPTLYTYITSINGLTATVQTFATGTSGNDFNISSLGSVHTFNCPTASATKRGCLSSADWTTFTNKLGAIGATTSGNFIFWQDSSGTMSTTGVAATNAAAPSTLAKRDVNGDIAFNAVTAALLGNANTASALFGTPTICSAGQAPRGILASGNATGCQAVSGGGGGSGDVLGPATNTDNFLPQWDGADSKTLKNGYCASQTGGTDCLVRMSSNTLDLTAAGKILQTETFAAYGPSYFQNLNPGGTAINVNRASLVSSAHIQNWRDETGVNLSFIDSTGKFNGNIVLTTTPTLCSSGQAARGIDVNGNAASCFAAGGSGSGDVLGPATNTDLFFPRWNGADSKTLSNGLVGASTAATPTSVMLRDSVGAFLGWDKGGTVYHCKAYGVVADGSTDDLAALNSCRDALPLSGGVMQLPCGDIAVSDTFNIGNGTDTGTYATYATRNAITVRGCGRGSEGTVTGDANAQQGATRIKASNTAFSSMSAVTVSAVTSGTPVRITATGHGISSGSNQTMVMVDGVGTNSAGTCTNDNGANGVWQALVIDANTLELRGSTGTTTSMAAGAPCWPKVYFGKPVIRVSGPVLNVQIEDLQIYGNASVVSSYTGEINTAHTAAIGLELRNSGLGTFKNVAVTRVGFLGLHMRASDRNLVSADGTNPPSFGLAFFNCGNIFYDFQYLRSMHQRTSGIHLGGDEEASSADSCSNKFLSLGMGYGGGGGSFGVSEQFADNNRFFHAQIYQGTAGAGVAWRSVRPAHDSQFPLGQNCDQCYLAGGLGGTPGTIGKVWFPNWPISEGYTPPHNNTSTAGFTDQGQMWNMLAFSSSADELYPTFAIHQLNGGTNAAGTLAFMRAGATLGQIQAHYDNGFSFYTSASGATPTLHTRLEPSHSIHHFSDSATDFNIYADLYSSAASGDRFGIQIRRNRGTQASPANVADGDRLATIVAWGRVNGSFAVGAVGSRIDTYADSTTGGTSMTSSSLRLATSIGGSLVDILTIKDYYIKTNPVSFANLPACSGGIEGARAYVTNANASTYHATVSGTGSAHTGIVCDGTNWLVE